MHSAEPNAWVWPPVHRAPVGVPDRISGLFTEH